MLPTTAEGLRLPLNAVFMPSFSRQRVGAEAREQPREQPEANFATYQVITRISAAAMMCGTAARSFCSMSVAGREIASIWSASSAAISDGTKTRMKTIVPATRESFTVSASPMLPPSLSAPAAARRFVDESAKDFRKQPADETEDRSAHDIRHHGEKLRQHRLHRFEEAVQFVRRKDRRQEEQDHQPEQHVRDRLAHRLHPGFLRQLVVERRGREDPVHRRPDQGREEPDKQREERAANE